MTHVFSHKIVKQILELEPNRQNGTIGMDHENSTVINKFLEFMKFCVIELHSLAQFVTVHFGREASEIRIPNNITGNGGTRSTGQA